MRRRHDWTSQIRRESRRLGLDADAVLAVASVEGLSGGVGDAGTSFGPFQLHVGGALPRGRGRAWAESPAGVRYALRQIAKVARGLEGEQAIRAIVTRFERPADPHGEIKRALDVYGKGVRPVPSVYDVGRMTPVRPGPLSLDRAGLLRQQLLSTPMGKPFDIMGFVSSLRSMAPESASSPAAPAAEAVSFTVPKGGKKVGRWQVTPGLNAFAKKFGLQITSGYRSIAKQRALYAGRSGPGTVAKPGNSWHNYGRAIDVAVNARARRAYQWALAHPELFEEAFFDPAGVYIKNGRIVKGAIGGHSDHIHFSLR